MCTKKSLCQASIIFMMKLRSPSDKISDSMWRFCCKQLYQIRMSNILSLTKCIYRMHDRRIIRIHGPERRIDPSSCLGSMCIIKESISDDDDILDSLLPEFNCTAQSGTS